MRSESIWQLATSWIHLFDWTFNKLMDCKCVEKCGWWGNTWAQNTKSGTESIFLYGSTHFMPFHTISCKKVELMSLKAWLRQVRPSCYTSRGSLYLQTIQTVATQNFEAFGRVWPGFRPPPTTKVTLGSDDRNIQEWLWGSDQILWWSQ